LALTLHYVRLVFTEFVMARWVRIAAVSDCPGGKSLETVAEDRIVALFNVGGQFFALDGVCPHQGGPLGKGCLTGTVVTCPWHGWQFDVRTGQHTFSANVRQPSLKVQVEADEVFVDLE
jgi:nitrite reductase (NADH) small subunit